MEQLKFFYSVYGILNSTATKANSMNFPQKIDSVMLHNQENEIQDFKEIY